MTKEQVIKKMIDRRVKKGNNREESIELLNELIRGFHPKNLGYALWYNDFCTERTCEKYAKILLEGR